MLLQARDARTEANAAEELSSSFSPSAAEVLVLSLSALALSSASLANRLAARPLGGSALVYPPHSPSALSL